MLGQRNGNPRSYSCRDYKDSAGYSRRLLWAKMKRVMTKNGRDYDATREWVNNLSADEAVKYDYIKQVYNSETHRYGDIDYEASREFMRRDLNEVMRNM